MKGSVLRKLKNEKLENMKNEYVTGLNTKATIEKKEDKLQTIEVKPASRPSLSSPKQLQKSKKDIAPTLPE